MRDTTFCPTDLTTFCRLDDLGLEVVGQQLHLDHNVLLCRVVEPDDWCPSAGRWVVRLLELLPTTAVTSLFCSPDRTDFYAECGFRTTSQLALPRGIVILFYDDVDWRQA